MLLPAVEEELKSVLASAKIFTDNSLEAMLAYHMGWRGEGAGEKARGKRIRPLLLLLSTLTNHGDWRLALPAAAAVELIHNFSLIHDDIEDNSEFRRGRETLWKRHQLPLALNAGDSMFSLAYLSLENLSPSLPQSTVLAAYQILSQTCLALTKGQHLDISFEQLDQVSVDDYLRMIEGKTAALLACATQLGAVLTGADQQTVQSFYALGFNLGLSFQIQDDYLGIWGDPAVTGKSAASDLIARKKTLPILFGIAQDQEFAEIWRQGKISEQNAPALADLLAAEGALDYTQERAEHYTGLALGVFKALPVENPAAEALEALARQLLNRSA
jgi:geranylgeranyl diphosphate synthase type I